jgi:hypothetical protein
MLAECFGAHLLAQNTDDEVVFTDSVTEMTLEMIDQARSKHVLIVGGYFHKYLQQSDFRLSVLGVAVFLNTSDPIPVEEVEIIRASENKGFLSWVLQEKKI